MSLFCCRIPWKIPSEAYTNPKQAYVGDNEYDYYEEGEEDDDGVPAVDADATESQSHAADSQIDSTLVTEPLIDPTGNECYVLWQGVLAKRNFTGFRFHVRVCFNTHIGLQLFN